MANRFQKDKKKLVYNTVSNKYKKDNSLKAYTPGTYYGGNTGSGEDGTSYEDTLNKIKKNQENKENYEAQKKQEMVTAITNYARQQGYNDDEINEYLVSQGLIQPQKQDKVNWFNRFIATGHNLSNEAITGAIKGIEGTIDNSLINLSTALSFLPKSFDNPILKGGLTSKLEGQEKKDSSLASSLAGPLDNLQKSSPPDWLINFVKKDFSSPIIEKFSSTDYVKNTEKDSFLTGNKAGEMIKGGAESIGQMLPSIVVGQLTGSQDLGTLLFSMGAAGNATEQALNSGAGIYQSIQYGNAVGVIEGAIEMLSGNIGGWGSNIFQKVLANGSGKVAAKLSTSTIFRLATNSISEGLEEVASEIVTPYLDRYILNEDTPNATLEQCLEAGILGSSIGLIMSGASLTNSQQKYLENLDNLRQIHENAVNQGNYKGADEIYQALKEEEAKAEAILGKEFIAKSDIMHKLKILEKLETSEDLAQNKQFAIDMYESISQDLKNLDKETREILINQTEIGLDFYIEGNLNKAYKSLSKEKQLEIRNVVRNIRNIDSTVNIAFEYSKDFNGNYDAATNTITLATNNSKNANAVALHEFLHKVRGTSQYSEIAKLATEVAKKDGSYDTKIENLKKKYQDTFDNTKIAKSLEKGSKEYEEALEEYVQEEFVADYIGDTVFAGNQKAINELVGKNESSAKKILNLFNKKTQDGNKLTAEEKKYYNKIKKSFKAAIEESKQQDIEKLIQNKESKNDLKFDLRDVEKYTSTPETKKQFIDAATDMIYKNQSKNTESKTKVKQRVEKYVEDMINVGQTLEDLGLTYTPNTVDSALKSNGDYIVSLDLSTICPKRINFQDIWNTISNENPNALNKSDSFFKLLDVMKDNKLTTPCGICFVESRRKILGPMTEKFLNSKKLDNPTKANQIKAKNQIIEFEKAEGRELTKSDLMNSDNLQLIKAKYPKLYDIYNVFYGAIKPKLSSPATNYKFGTIRNYVTNEDGSLNTQLIKDINDHGGLRFLSYSDFEIEHAVDFMQMIFEASELGLKVQAYTKMPELVQIVKDTNVKLNLSVVLSLKEDGTFDFSSVQGMDIEVAKSLRDENGNIGIIAVGPDIITTLKLMNTDYIDYIIPFHRSNLSKAEFKKVGIDGYFDATMYQNEKDGLFSSKKAEQNTPQSEYWNYNVDGNQNSKNYIKYCVNHNIKPKFADIFLFNTLRKDGKNKILYEEYLNNNNIKYEKFKYKGTEFIIPDGYWKTLGDYRNYDNNGKSSPQKPVKLTSNVEQILEQIKQSQQKPFKNKLSTGEYVSNEQLESLKKKTINDFYNEIESKPKFSLKDSDGNTLTAEQQKYFKDVSSLLKDKNGSMYKFYFGTSRADIIGDTFSSEKSFSGPLQTFTNVKKDAKSQMNIDENAAYYIKPDDFYKDITSKETNKSFGNTWKEFTMRDQEKILNRMLNYTYDIDYKNGKAYPKWYYKGSNTNTFGDFRSLLVDYDGNAFKAITHAFLNEARQYNYEPTIENFKNLLDSLNLSEFYNISGPDMKPKSGLYAVYLNVKNPLNTSDKKLMIKVLENLNKIEPRFSYQKIKNEKDSYGAKLTDKNVIRNISSFTTKLREDIAYNRNTAWESVPDYVTDYLKSEGYDGIYIETGKKNKTKNVIPFYPNQIKSVDNKKPTGNMNIRYSLKDMDEISKNSVFNPDDTIRFSIKDGKLYDNYDNLYNTGKVNGTDIFDTSTLGLSDYNNLIPGSPENEYMKNKKNVIGKIVYMTPQEYYEKCSNEIFKKRSPDKYASVEELKENRIKSPYVGYIDKLKEIITKKGLKFPMPFIDYANVTQEGLHRMMVAGDLYGWNNVKHPVLVVDTYDKQLQKKWDLLDDVDYVKKWGKFDKFKYDNYSELIEELNYEFDDQLQDGKKYTFNIEDDILYITRSGVTVEQDLTDFKIKNRYFDDVKYSLKDQNVSKTKQVEGEYVKGYAESKTTWKYERKSTSQIYKDMLDKIVLPTDKVKVKGGEQKILNYLFQQINKDKVVTSEIADNIVDYVFENVTINKEYIPEDFKAELKQQFKQDLYETVFNGGKKTFRTKMFEKIDEVKEKIDTIKEKNNMEKALKSVKKYIDAVKEKTKKASFSKNQFAQNVATLVNDKIEVKGVEYNVLDYLLSATEDITSSKTREIVKEYVKHIKKYNSDEKNWNKIEFKDSTLEEINMLTADERLGENLTSEEIRVYSHLIQGINQTIKEYLDSKLALSAARARKESLEVQEDIIEKPKVNMNKIKQVNSAIIKMPIRIKYFEGSSTGEKFGLSKYLVERMQKAEIKYYENIMDLESEFNDFFKKHKKFQKRLLKETIKIESAELTLAEAISLYELSKRPDASRHFVLEEEKNAKGIVIYDKFKNLKNTLLFDENPKDMIEEKFDEETMEFIEVVENMFNVKARNLKIDADIQYLGYTNASEEFYYPINTDKGSRSRKYGQIKLSKEVEQVYGQSYNKNTLDKATNAIVLRGVDYVVSDHIDRVSKYNAYIVPVTQINRTMNYRDKKGDISLDQRISYTQAGFNAAIDQWIVDIIQTRNYDAEKNFINKMNSRLAISSLGVNIKVALTQASAYFLAFKYLSIGSMAKGVPVHKISKSFFTDMDKYCPYVKFRNYNSDLVTQEIGSKALGDVQEVLMLPITKMDRITIQRIWIAAQYEIQKKSGEKFGTEANKTLAGKLLETIIRDSQAVDTLEQTTLHRKDSALLRPLLLFSKQTTQMFNSLAGAALENKIAVERLKANPNDPKAQELVKKSRTQLAKSITGTSFSILTDTLLTMLAAAVLGKDDDDENKVAEFALEFGTNVIGMVPLMNQFANLIQGYDVSVNFLDNINKLKDTLAAIPNMIKTGNYRGAWYQWSKALGPIVGIPFKTVNEYGLAIISAFNPELAYKYRSIWYNKQISEYLKDLEKSIKSKDEDMAATIIEEIYKEKGMSIDDESIEELLNIAMSGTALQFPQQVNKKITVNSEEYELTNKEYREMKEIYSKNLNEAIEDLTWSTKYESLTDEQKANALKAVQTAAYFKSLQDLGLDIDGLFEANKINMMSKALDTSKMAILKEYKDSLKGVSNQKEKIEKYITRDLGLRGIEKELMLALYYQPDKNTYAKISNHLTSKGYSPDEVNIILKKLKYIED